MFDLTLHDASTGPSYFPGRFRRILRSRFPLYQFCHFCDFPLRAYKKGRESGKKNIADSSTILASASFSTISPSNYPHNHVYPDDCTLCRCGSNSFTRSGLVPCSSFVPPSPVGPDGPCRPQLSSRFCGSGRRCPELHMLEHFYIHVSRIPRKCLSPTTYVRTNSLKSV